MNNLHFGCLSSKIFSGLKKILWTFSRYSSCFRWNVEINRPSDRRAARLFWETIACGKITAFCEAEQHEARDFVLYVGRYQAFFSGVVHRISTILATTGNRTGMAYVKIPFVQFLTFKRVNFAVEDSWILHFLIFLPVVSHSEVMKDMKLGFHAHWFPAVFVFKNTDRIWPLTSAEFWYFFDVL